MIKEGTEKKHLTDLQKKILKYAVRICVVIVLMAAWIFIVKYGVEFGKGYIDDALSDVEMRNIENHQQLTEQNIILNKDIQALNDDLAALRNEVTNLNDEISVFSLEVESLKSSIDFIDTSVTNSILIQGEIGTKILELDSRLKDLRNSLNILLEAPQ